MARANGRYPTRIVSGLAEVQGFGDGRMMSWIVRNSIDVRGYGRTEPILGNQERVLNEKNEVGNEQFERSGPGGHRMEVPWRKFFRSRSYWYSAL